MTRAEILHHLRVFLMRCKNMDGSYPSVAYPAVLPKDIEAIEAVVAGMEAREAEAGRAA